MNNSALDPGTTTCGVGQPVASDSTCALGLEFSPVTTGNPVAGDLIVLSNAVDVPVEIFISGQVLSVDPTIMTLSSSQNPVALGTSVVFMSHVTTSGQSTPTGTVNFMDGTELIGSAALDATSTASFSTATLAAGLHTIAAVYSGDNQNAAATSAVLIENVQQPTTTTLVSSSNPTPASASVTFQATVAGQGGSGNIPSGTVTFSDGQSVVGSGTLNASGVATLSIASLQPGQRNITASYPGNTTYLPSQSSVLLQTVSLVPTMTSLASSISNTYVGQGVTFTTVVSRTDAIVPTGVVRFMDGSNAMGASTLDGNGTAVWVAAGFAAGTHSISAIYAGDTNNLTSTSPVLLEVVQQLATATAISASVNPANAGAALQLSATVAPVSAIGKAATGTQPLSGNISFQDGATILGSSGVSAAGVASLTLSTLSVGPHTITATYAGDTNYVGSTSSPMLETVISSTTSTLLASSNTPSIAGRPVTLTVTVSGSGATPSGTVAFLDGTGLGATSLGTMALNAKGVAAFTVSSLAVGQHSLTAVYSGDAKNNASSSAPLAQIVQIATSTTALASTASSSAFGANVTFTASIVTNGGTLTGNVTFADGPALLGTVPVNGGSAAFNTSTLALGSHPIVATYSGDSNNSGNLLRDRRTAVRQRGDIFESGARSQPTRLQRLRSQQG